MAILFSSTTVARNVREKLKARITAVKTRHTYAIVLLSRTMDATARTGCRIGSGFSVKGYN